MFRLTPIFTGMILAFLVSCTLPPKGLVGTGGYSFYTAHWYTNPFDKNSPTSLGSNDYVADPQKTYGLLLLYCTRDKKEIPRELIWQLKYPPKPKNDSARVHTYKKNKRGDYIKRTHGFTSPHDKIVPIEECYKDGFCLIYRRYSDGERIFTYVRKQDIYFDKEAVMLNRYAKNIPDKDAIACPEIF